jgi:hypothetical protein
MLNRLSSGVLGTAAAALLLLPLEVLARQPFDAKAFEKENPGLVVYEVNFDNDKNVLRKFGVQAQATLIVFKGAKEVGRSTGESDAARIQALIEKGS